MAVTKRKRKKKPYRAEVFVSGVRVVSQSFETAAAAHKWHDDTKRRWSSGRGPLGEVTLSELIDDYRETQFSRMARSTQHRMDRNLIFLAESPIAERRMEDFDGRAVDEYLAWLLAHPRAKTPTRGSFHMEMRTLRAVLTYFREEQDELFVVPITKRHFRKAWYKPAVPKRLDFFIPPEKLNPWLDALGQAKDPVYRVLATVQVVMGLRIGELVALCWDAIDLDEGLIDVKRTMDWLDEKGRPIREPADRTKTTASARTLPMPGIVREALLEAKRLNPLSTVVFRNRLGRVVRYKSVLENYRAAFEAIGLDRSGTHICRHTNATLGTANGLHLEEARINLGHTSEVETRAYAKVHAMLKNRLPDRVAEFIDGNSIESHAQDHARYKRQKKKTGHFSK